MSTIRLHHVQVSCPPGGEDAARAFWAGALGLTEVDKPEPLRGRGGAWFRAHDDAGRTTAEVHVGVEDPHAPARKAHPALLVDDEAALDAVAARVRAVGCEVDDAERHTFPGYLRLHLRDPFGNRIEVLAPSPG
ncbi:VOC family protein [Nocardioides litoris]|uniref:VOC family protein n=1 Tax=Nocardioides litoris TaxID=1926648 RepID=UPI001FEB8892|nr:VOC family protein [Nocardioides litoris]